MRLRLGAAAGAAIVLVGVIGAPTLPVMIGATLAYAWLLWRRLEPAEDRSRGAPRVATVLRFPVRPRLRRARWWERWLRRLRYGRLRSVRST